MTSTVAAPNPGWRLAAWRIRLHRLLARRPEIWLYGVSAVAGVVVVATALSHPGDGPRGRASWAEAWSLLTAWSGWMAMVVAMMLPVIAPQARHVALYSLRRRRSRAMAGYVAGYLGVWGLIGVALVVAFHLAGLRHPPPGLAVGALVGAALWQVSKPRRRVLRRCGSLRLGAPKGFAADVDCATAGWRSGRRCAFTCGPVMVASAAAHHHPAVMGAILVLLLTERARGPNPAQRAGRPLEAWAFVGLAAAVAFVAVT